MSLRWWNQTAAGEVFGADLRSLALFRIVLGLLVLLDLAGRAVNLRAHYTDEGVLPRVTVIRMLNPWRWSVNLANGTLDFQALIFLMTAVAAVGLILGFKTRFMNILVWILLFSIQVRNPLILSNADTLLRVLLFWGMLLPLGARWSFDRRTLPSPRTFVPQQILSFATIGLFLQIAFMYWFTAAMKWDPIWVSNGTALFYATGAGQITRPFGEYIHQFPTLLRALTHFSLVFEFVAPVLLFVPWFRGKVRTAAIVSIMAFHAGIFLMMDVGMFSWISPLCMVCFLPAWFWDTALPRVRDAVVGRFPAVDRLRGWVGNPASAFSRVPRGIALTPALASSPGGIPIEATAADNRITAASRMVPGEHAGGTSSEPGRRSPGSSPWLNAFAAFCLVFIFGWNMSVVTDYTMPEGSTQVGYGLGLYQYWNMFAPHPPTVTTWYVIRGELKNEQEVDLLTPIVHNNLNLVAAPSWERPENISGYYHDQYWRKIIQAMGSNSNASARQTFAGYICRTWNGHYGGDVLLVDLQIYRMSEPTLLNGDRAPIQRSLVAEYTCT